MNRARIVGYRVQRDPETLAVPAFITRIFVFQDLRSPCELGLVLTTCFPRVILSSGISMRKTQGAMQGGFLFYPISHRSQMMT
jgi:hypothetical protein